MADTLPFAEGMAAQMPPERATALAARMAAAIRRVRIEWHAPSLWVLLFGCVVAATLAALVAMEWSDRRTLAQAALVRLSTQSYRSAYAAVRAVAGEATAFEALEQARAKTQQAASLVAESSLAEATVADVIRRWEALRTHLDALRAQREPVIAAARVAHSLSERGPALHDALEQISALMVRSGAGANELAAVQRLDLLTQRITQNAKLQFATIPVAPDSSLHQSDADVIDRILLGLIEGSATLRLAPERSPEVRRQLSALRESFNGQRAAVAMLMAYIPSLNAAKSAAAAAMSSADAIADAVDKARSEPRSWTASGRVALLTATAALLLTALACLAIIVRRARADAQPAQEELSSLAGSDWETQTSRYPAADDPRHDPPALVLTNLRQLAEQIQDAADKVAEAGGRAERAAKRRMSQLADVAVEWELSSEELATELAQVSVELERAVGSLAGDDWTALQKESAGLDGGPPPAHQRKVS